MVSVSAPDGTGAASPESRRRASIPLRGALDPLHQLATVLALADEVRCVHGPTDLLGISGPPASEHLGVQRHTALVVGVRPGTETRYSSSDPHVVRIARGALGSGGEPPAARSRRLARPR